MSAFVLNQFFLLRDGAPTALLVGTYQPWLVALSFGIAALTSALALQLAGMAARTSGGGRQLTLLSGSVAMGGGIWAMHFIGMLAFRLCTVVDFHPGLTLVSMLPALLASWVALNLLARGAMNRWQYVWGGVLVGGGIGAMHYSGMAAMEVSAQLRYDPLGFAASIVVAVLLAMLALWIRFGLQQRVRPLVAIALGGLVMGGAIAGMHYTAMAAARFVGESDEICFGGLDRNGYLALGITVVTLTISLLTAGANGLLRYRALNRQMRTEKQRMQAMLDTAVDGIVSIDGHGIIRSFNGAAERLFGWRADELLGRNVSLLMPEPDRSRHDGYLHTHLSTGRTSIIGVGRDVTGQHKDGRPLPIRLAIGRVEQAGEPLFVAFVSDISERQQMEQALRDSEQQYRSLIANSPGVTFRCRIDADWSMVLVSDAIETLSGWPAQDFLDGRIHCGDLVHRHDRERVDAAILAALAADGPYVLEYRLMTREGGERWVSETGRAAADAAGRRQWIDGVIIDISESKRLQLQLEEAKERAEAAVVAKSAFLANMSHEIRTPRNAILGFTELLLDTTLGEAQRKHLNTVRGSARSLLGLLNDILDTAKLEKGAVELERVDFSLRAVCEQALNSLRLLAQRKGLVLQLDYPEDEARYFKGDALRVQQVLLNLVGNAIKFTEQGAVTLAMRMEMRRDTPIDESIGEPPDRHGGEPQIHLSVIDTGIGIAPDRLGHIFDAFAQADASTTRRFGGTGLGTTISRQLVERMGGRITVDSVPGEGSCFHVWLPLPAGAPVQAGAAEEQLAISLPPLRLLVADDVAQNGELLQLLLGRDGHRIRLVGDGLQALQAFSEEQFDVVLMDVHMPNLDGLAATRRIRQFELTQHRPRTPVIALTASVLEEDRQAALAAGMDGFATKPVEPLRLNAELARVLGLMLGQAPLPGAAGGADMSARVMVDADANAALNCEQGLRLWGNASAWRRALRRFAAEQADGGPRLLALLRGAQWLDARALVHRWRGVAGSLALPALLAAAGPLEDALRLGLHEQVLDKGEQLARALQQVLEAVAELDAAGASAPMPLGTEPPAGPQGGAQTALLQRMERALKHGELDDAALQQLIQRLGVARCAPLIEALDQFDFDAGLQALRALRA
ncbi:MAG: PAS domain S-box protein [Burkholderiaceae bacterium]